MRFAKKIIPLVAVVFILLGSVSSVYANDYPNKAYYIENYHVKVNVLQNNTLQVTEDIDAYFNNERHGIFRYIPVENYIKRSDGSADKVSAKVKHIRVSEKYDGYYDDNNNYVLQIGDADETVIGRHSYTVSYEYQMGRDVCEGFDELYYNIIGSGWDTYIKNVSFDINMPKPFDKSKLGFSAGAYGNSGTDDVKLSIKDNCISGSLNRVLRPYEAFTMRIELEDGYFKFNMLAYYLKHVFIVGIPLLALAAVIVLWAKFGRDKKIIDVVEFYPPENMNSAEIAFWFNGSVQGEKTIGLLIELANEGFLEIEEQSKKNFVIRKRKDYYGDDECKRIFFNGLFVSKDEVTKNDLENRFYVYPEKIVRRISAVNQEKVFSKRSLMMRAAGWLISIAAGVASYFILQTSFSSATEMICFAAGVLICLLSFIFSFFIRQRTDRGHEVKQRINGFKIFLETAQKDQLEEMAEKNPKYYYDVLPFAYVLGVSDVWTKKFEGIAVEPPEWFVGGHYSTLSTYYLIHSAMSSAARAMTSVPQSSGSSSGGFSSGGGGGFAGGGVGGGGGGSW